MIHPLIFDHEQILNAFCLNDDDLNFGTAVKPYSPRLATKEGCQVITEHWLPYEITTTLNRPRTT